MGTDTQLVAQGGVVPLVALDTDDSLTADSDFRVATQQAVKAYVDAGGVAGEAAAQALIDDMTFTISEMTASGALPDATVVTLNSTTPLIAATLAAPTAGQLLIITQVDAGTAGHTLTLAAGTFDGTNNIATLDAGGEALVLLGLSATRFLALVNLGSVAFSS